jgi:hypothetical protein
MPLPALSDTLQGVAVRCWQLTKVRIESHIAGALWHFYDLSKFLGGCSNGRW